MNSRVKTAWLFLAPMVLLMLVVAVWPLARSIWFSFTDININDISAAEFVGWENYFGEYGLFFNPNEEGGFWAGDWGVSIRNTFSFAVVSVILETLTGLGVALLLNQEFKGRAWVRTAVLVPWAIPTIVSAKMWGWMLNDQFGVINNYLLALGLISQK
ncbi:MAG: carbohydrate ABC transporter permease, partial [Limnohabitans sp.]